MSAVTFDILKLAQRLRDNAKFPPEQAEQTAVALAESFADWQMALHLATKADVASIKTDITAVRAELSGTRSDLEKLIAETKVEIIKWVVGIGFAQVAMILAVLKLH